MQKKLWIPVVMLVATCIFLAGRSLGGADSLPATPQIIRRVALTNQTAPIPTTTLFTPAKNGLYRVSTYFTGTAGQGQEGWVVNLSWTDDAGAEDTNPAMLASQGQGPPKAWAQASYAPGSLAVLEAVAGQPVTYSVGVSGSGGGPAGYSLYIIVERLAP